MGMATDSLKGLNGAGAGTTFLERIKKFDEVGVEL